MFHCFALETCLDCLCPHCCSPDGAGVWIWEGGGIGKAPHASGLSLVNEGDLGFSTGTLGCRARCQGVTREVGAGTQLGAGCMERWVQMWVGAQMCMVSGFRRGWVSRCAQYWGANVRWVLRPVGASTRHGVPGCAWGKAGAQTGAGFSVWCRAGSWVWVRCWVQGCAKLGQGLDPSPGLGLGPGQGPCP